MIKFEVGKKYFAVEDGAKDTQMEVLRRTKCYIIINNEFNEEQRIKIKVVDNEEFLDSSLQPFYKPHLYRASAVVNDAVSNATEMKRLCKLIRDGKATIDDEIKYYKLMVDSSKGSLLFASQFKLNKLMQEKKAKATPPATKEPVMEIILDSNRLANDWLKVYNAKLMKGDLIRITFKDGAVSVGKITEGRFGNYYVRSKQDYEQRMYLDYRKVFDDKQVYASNVEKISKIELLEKSKLAKVPLFKDNKTLKGALAFWCRDAV